MDMAVATEERARGRNFGRLTFHETNVATGANIMGIDKDSMGCCDATVTPYSCDSTVTSAFLLVVRRTFFVLCETLSLPSAIFLSTRNSLLPEARHRA